MSVSTAGLSGRYRYAWGGMVLTSTTALPELTPVRRKTAGLCVKWTRVRSNVRSCEWIHHWIVPGGKVWLAIGRKADGYIFRFQRFADFHWAGDRRVLTCHIRRGAQMKTVRHLLLDQVLPVLASNGPANGLHASAVLIEGGAVAFVGETGCGKSTLAAFFAAAGHSVITDDCLMLEQGPNGLRAVPTYPSLRLWEDAADTLGHRLGRRQRVAEYSRKIRISARSSAAIPFCVDPVPLRRVYILGKLAARRPVEIECLSQRDAFIQLIRFGFRVDPYHPANLAREMDRVADLARLVPVRRLRIPWQLDALPSIRHAVLNDVRKPTSPAPGRSPSAR